MKKLVLILAVAMFVIAPAANAQVLELSTWPVPSVIASANVNQAPVADAAVASESVEQAQEAAVPVVVASVVQTVVAVPVVSVNAVTVTDVRPPVCNPLKGCGVVLAPGQVIVSPPRAGFCNPYELADPCNAGRVPVGVVVVNPDRPGIPCNKYTADRHCPGGVFPG